MAGELQVQCLLGVLATVALLVWYRDSLGYLKLFFCAQNIVYGAIGIYAFKFAGNTKAKLYGLFLLATTGAFSVTPLLTLNLQSKVFREPVAALQQIHPEFLLGWFLWRFVELYPSRVESVWGLAFVRICQAVSLITGSFFIFVGFAHYFERLGMFSFLEEMGISERVVDDSLRYLISSAWYCVIPQVLLAICFVAVRWFFLRKRFGSQVTLFMLGLSLGYGLPMAEITFEPLPTSYQVWARASELNKVVAASWVQIFLLLTPLMTGYAILAHKALNIRTLARSAVRYLLARFSATAIALIPFVALVTYLVRSKEQTVQELLSGPQAILLIGLTTSGFLLMRFRQSILDSIDKRFFRDRYNARKVLTELADQVRGTRTLTEVSNLVCQGIDLALHVERGSLLILDPTQGRFLDPLDEIRPLDTASKLSTMLQGTREPLVVDFEGEQSPLADLPDGEKHWLIDAKVDLLSPMYALDGNLIGILVLGRKKSDEPFSQEDKGLVKGVCSSTGLVIELLQLKERTPMPKTRRIARSTGEVEILDERESGQVATECMTCSRVYPSKDSTCPDCETRLQSTLVPYVLHGQYRFESRLGSGGMAVVYRATDLRLGREVAIKTLPRVSPEASMRLHREARTAATVTDLGLAAIYGIESWEGMPLLIQEYLRGGTLSAKLKAGETLSPSAMVETGRIVALALQKIHDAGILHRDLKPSNIGYTLDGQPKLLDFGVARIQHDLRQDTEVGATGPLDDKSRILNTQSWMVGHTATGQLVGTIGYLSPEAVLGLSPDQKVDLWALSVVLWESISGTNLFGGSKFQQILDAIREVKIPDLRDFEPSCPQPVLDFFALELSRDPSRRAQSGRDMHDRLTRLRAELEG